MPAPKSLATAEKDNNAQPYVDAPADRKTVLGETLRRRIVSMEMAPGTVVDEMALSEEFGLSRPPVRELLRQLAAEGYIDLEANRAARVSSMSFQSLRSFFQAAPLIYIATTQLAAKNATRSGINELKLIQKRFRTAIEENDVESRVIYNDQFHLEIGKMAQNDYLLPSLRRLLIDHARLGKIFYRHPTTRDMEQDLETAVQQHDQIIEAIERHDAEAAGSLVRAHLELSRHRMAEYAAPEGVEVPLAY
ncbi:GntR family transcriptional regulator [Azohydromonas caseinilytica]|uniref:GntR family transcriptional regulator n=1 Tax=Azohydromonas caseinilytica TaxID=2728836 RepID=A0A848FEI8_9BURK|nr:GntR family transcriptional regulator [Azohydromonas caseinilytica]NML16769.1 GntR family transcriptional regulator [Azohydromonas caseinilytica]